MGVSSSTKFGEWDRGPDVGPAGSGGILVACDRAFERLQQLGVAIPPGSRFQLARKAVDEAHQRKGGFPSAEVMVESTRAIFELYWIVRALGGMKELPKRLRVELKDMMKGPRLPQDENDRNSHGRNIQFQLFVGAFLASGGVEVVSAEPDLIVNYFGHAVGVAAKRVFSRKKFLPNVKAAIEQIESSGRSGFVAVNVDRLIDDLALQPTENLTERFDREVTELPEALKLVQAHNTVGGLIALGMHVAWQSGTDEHPRPRVQMSEFCYWRLIPHEGITGGDVKTYLADFRARQAAHLKAF